MQNIVAELATYGFTFNDVMFLTFGLAGLIIVYVVYRD